MYDPDVMHLTNETTVADAAATLAGAARIFEILGIDYCCGGSRTLARAATNAGLQADELIALLRGTRPPDRSVAPAMLDEKGTMVPLLDVLVSHHHRFTRSRLADIDRELSRLLSAHTAAQPALRNIRHSVDRLIAELIPHMRNEEQMLFPYIRSMEEPLAAGQESIVPMFGTVRYPLQSIVHDHREDLEIMDDLRLYSGDFTPPSDACETQRRLYADLESLDRDLRQHIHIENDLLFPRAVEKERAAGETTE
jgi:regulator of cell morphogenesis and NO signaling